MEAFTPTLLATTALTVVFRDASSSLIFAFSDASLARSSLSFAFSISSSE
jgi:hypothetical protein